MGLISFILDCVVITSACAGARRMTGFNVGQKVVDMVKNEKALTFTKAYFNLGEWVVDKSVNYARKKIIQNNLNEFKDYTIKPSSTEVQNSSHHHNNNNLNHQHQKNQYTPFNNQQQQQQQQPDQSQQNNHNQQYRF